MCVCLCVSYHAVHSEVVVLGLQLHGVGVVVADLRVARQEQTLVVHDPVEHLDTQEGKKMQIVLQKALHIKRGLSISCLLRATALRIRDRLLFGVCN